MDTTYPIRILLMSQIFLLVLFLPQAVFAQPTTTQSDQPTQFENNKISGRVWVDLNANGLQDTDEPGIADVRVTLLDANNAPLNTTFTDINGQYQFINLMPSTYRVRFTQPFGYQGSPANEGGDDTLDSDAHAGTGITEAVSLDENTLHLSADAGYYQLASIGGRVFEDQNQNGLQEDVLAEPGVPNLVITLWLDDEGDGVPDEEVNQTTTDTEGRYGFGNLPPGNWYIVEGERPGGFSFTQMNVQDETGEQSLTAIDSDVNLETGQTPPLRLLSGDQLDTVDVGLILSFPAAIGNRVFDDLDGDGVQDRNDPGVLGIQVNLYLDADGNGTPDRLLDAVITDDEGHYWFNSLNPLRVYIVEFLPPTGRVLSPQNNSGNDIRDSDPNPNTGWTDPITLSPSEVEDSIDAGLMPIPDSASVTGVVFEDQNGDGIRTLNEPGVLGATVQLWTILETSPPDESGDSDVDGTNSAMPDGVHVASTTRDRCQLCRRGRADHLSGRRRQSPALV
ncbi:MAG: SdrD B-like domain-containing protein [Chloroflexota bacterium]